MERAESAAKVRAVALVMSTVLLAVSSFAQDARSASADRVQRVVIVSISDRKLAVVEDGDVLATFQVAVGATLTPSPTGEFQIVSRVSNPTYYRAGKVIPTGRDNPLGTRWLGLSQKGYGIHGTNAPRSVGHAASHGCIRLRNREMDKLFSMVRVGDAVVIRGERDDQIADIFGGNSDDSTVAENEVAPEAAGR